MGRPSKYRHRSDISIGLNENPIYNLWYNIKSRCYNKNNSSYHNYGAKGVIMCEEWKNNFLSFYDWCVSNGWRKGLQIDKDKLSKTNAGKIYSPEYCCFLTRKENNWYKNNSLLIDYNNQTKSLAEWGNELGLDMKLVQSRLYNRKWSVKDAFEIPIQKLAFIVYNNESKSLPDWCRQLKLKYSRIWGRINEGWSIKSAFETATDGRFKHKTISQQ